MELINTIIRQDPGTKIYSLFYVNENSVSWRARLVAGQNQQNLFDSIEPWPALFPKFLRAWGVISK